MAGRASRTERRRRGGGARRAALAAFFALLAAGCTGPERMSFLPPIAKDDTGMAVAALAGGQITLAAPDGFCIDPASLRRGESEGFALMADCARLHPRGFLSRLAWRRDAAVLTAAIGAADPGGAAPGGAELAAAFDGAEVLEQRGGLALPLVKVSLRRPTAAGASPVHWRGAFRLNGRLVAVALYAPEGSDSLGARGAELLDELARRTKEATAVAGYLTQTPAP